jgi:hypothetical protein
MQHLAIRVLCTELVKIGILVNGTLEELVQRNVTTAFYYHGNLMFKTNEIKLDRLCYNCHTQLLCLQVWVIL